MKFTGIDLGDSAYLQLVDSRGNLLYGPEQAELREYAARAEETPATSLGSLADKLQDALKRRGNN